ncbi:hypothetical protein NDU88_002727 [Pleurodeles waltl]|uniref:Uncharacterized protein n=1 Tax=Pleurodeles waltl TaxID=8319 RepID=A0AAV7LDB6_PLEWA|nr:hypothetical protein NDU88_002727 [Pleurodeles waltl]
MLLSAFNILLRSRDLPRPFRRRSSAGTGLSPLCETLGPQAFTNLEYNRRGLRAPRLSTPTRARRALLLGPQCRYAATRPLIHFAVPRWAAPSTSLQPEGAPAPVPICPEPHLRALCAIAASHLALEAAPQLPSSREQQTSSPSNQNAPSSRPHRLRCSIRPQSSAVPRPALNVDFVQSTTWLFHIAASLRLGRFHSDRSPTRPQSPPGLAASLGLLSSATFSQTWLVTHLPYLPAIRCSKIFGQ